MSDPKTDQMILGSLLRIEFMLATQAMEREQEKAAANMRLADALIRSDERLRKMFRDAS